MAVRGLPEHGDNDVKRPLFCIILLVFAACGRTPGSSNVDPAGTAGAQGVGTAGSAGTPGGSGAPGGSGTPGSAGTPGSGGSGGRSPQTDTPEDPGVSLNLELGTEAWSELAEALAEARLHDAASLQQAHRVPFQDALGYDPRTATGLDLIQSSNLSLSEAELALLAKNGFVIAPRRQFPTFPYGYFTIYAEDLPVFVSADMVLEAVHRSYSDILEAIEIESLVPRLSSFLSALRGRLGSGEHGLSEEVARDLDTYLTIAHSLLLGATQTPSTNISSNEVSAFVTAAELAEGEKEMSLFGVHRIVDLSQFKPRGHYVGIEVLERYFRAMMWLGRIDFRMIETQPDGSRIFRRRQVEAALGLHQLTSPESLQDWQFIDRVVGAFVGEHDYMHLGQIDPLLTDLGVSSAEELAGVPDQRLAQAIVDGHYGEQRIASHIIYRVPGSDTFPLNASFAVFGQRYVVDSHVFSNLVYDRVETRILPNPLDAAFAALGNDHAALLLFEELEQHPYAGELAAMRTLVDSYSEDYWDSSLYTGWLGALRSISPSSEASAPTSEGLPSIARTESWGRRLVNTQLASWAQLRHDTLLYAKQSYTSGSVCEFPDAYVEPYPEFFHAMGRFASQGQNLVHELGLDLEAGALAAQVSTYFGNLSRIMTTLGEMAELQRSGSPHSAEHVAFINQAIRVEGGGSGPPLQTGWYKDLFFDPAGALEFDPTIADVHTDPGGVVPIGRGASVLHVATGHPRLMVMTVDSCQGPRAYAGIIFSYHEHLAAGLTRLDDQQWQQMLNATPVPADVPWLADVLGPR